MSISVYSMYVTHVLRFFVFPRAFAHALLHLFSCFVTQQLAMFSEKNAQECEQEIEEINEIALSASNVEALPVTSRSALTDFRMRAMTVGLFSDAELFHAEESALDELNAGEDREGEEEEEELSELDMELAEGQGGSTRLRSPSRTRRGKQKHLHQARSSSYRRYSTATNNSDGDEEDEEEGEGEGASSALGAMLGWIGTPPKHSIAQRHRPQQRARGGSTGLGMVSGIALFPVTGQGDERRNPSATLCSVSEDSISPLHAGNSEEGRGGDSHAIPTVPGVVVSTSSESVASASGSGPNTPRSTPSSPHTPRASTSRPASTAVAAGAAMPGRPPPTKPSRDHVLSTELNPFLTAIDSANGVEDEKFASPETELCTVHFPQHPLIPPPPAPPREVIPRDHHHHYHAHTGLPPLHPPMTTIPAPAPAPAAGDHRRDTEYYRSHRRSGSQSSSNSSSRDSSPQRAQPEDASLH